MKIITELPVQFHGERVRDMLAGAFNLTPWTVGEEAYEGFFKRAFAERFKWNQKSKKR